MENNIITIRADVWLHDTCLVCQTKHSTTDEKLIHEQDTVHNKKVVVYDFISKELSCLVPCSTKSKLFERYCRSGTPVTGLECICELSFSWSSTPFWACTICYVAGYISSGSAETHLLSSFHKRNYISEYHPTEFANMIRIQEKSDVSKHSAIEHEIIMRILCSNEDQNPLVYEIHERSREWVFQKLGLNEEDSRLAYTLEPVSDEHQMMYCQVCGESFLSFEGDEALQKSWSIHLSTQSHQRCQLLISNISELPKEKRYESEFPSEIKINNEMAWVDENGIFYGPTCGAEQLISFGDTEYFCCLCFCLISKEDCTKHLRCETHIERFLRRSNSSRLLNISYSTTERRHETFMELLQSDRGNKSFDATPMFTPLFLRNFSLPESRVFVETKLREENFGDYSAYWCHVCMKYVKKLGPEAWEDHIYEEEHFTWIVKRTLIHLEKEFFVNKWMVLPNVPRQRVERWEEKVIGKETLLVQNHCEFGLEWLAFDAIKSEYVCQCCSIIYAESETESVVYHARSFDHILRVLHLSDSQIKSVLWKSEDTNRQKELLLEYLHLTFISPEAQVQVYDPHLAFSLNGRALIPTKLLSLATLEPKNRKAFEEKCEDLSCIGLNIALNATHLEIRNINKKVIIFYCQDCRQTFSAFLDRLETIWTDHLLSKSHWERKNVFKSNQLNENSKLPTPSPLTVWPFDQPSNKKKMTWKWNSEKRCYQFVYTRIGLKDISHRNNFTHGSADFFCTLCAKTFPLEQNSLEDHARSFEHTFFYVHKYRSLEVPDLEDILLDKEKTVILKRKNIRRLFAKILKGAENEDLSIPVYDLLQISKPKYKDVAQAIDLDELHFSSIDEIETVKKKLLTFETQQSLMLQGLQCRNVQQQQPPPKIEAVDGKLTLDNEAQKILDESLYNEMDEIKNEENEKQEQQKKPISSMPKTSVSVGQPEGKSSSSKDGALPKPKLNRKSSPLRKPIPLRKRPISPLRKRPISLRVRTVSQSRKSPSPLAIQPALVKKEFLPSKRRASLEKRYVAYKPIGVPKPGSSSTTARDRFRRGRSRDQDSKRHRFVSRNRSPQRNLQHISHAKPPSLRPRSPSPMDISPDRSPRKVIQNVSTDRRVTPQMFPSKNATKSTWEAPVENNQTDVMRQSTIDVNSLLNRHSFNEQLPPAPTILAQKPVKQPGTFDYRFPLSTSIPPAPTNILPPPPSNTFSSPPLTMPFGLWPPAPYGMGQPSANLRPPPFQPQIWGSPSKKPVEKEETMIDPMYVKMEFYRPDLQRMRTSKELIDYVVGQGFDRISNDDPPLLFNSIVKRKKGLLGVSFLYQIICYEHSELEMYYCEMCNHFTTVSEIFLHLSASMHRLNYMQRNYKMYHKKAMDEPDENRRDELLQKYAEQIWRLEGSGECIYRMRCILNEETIRRVWPDYKNYIDHSWKIDDPEIDITDSRPNLSRQAPSGEASAYRKDATKKIEWDGQNRMGIEEKFRSKVEADKVRRELPSMHDSRKNREMSEHEKSRNESSKHMTRELKWKNEAKSEPITKSHKEYSESSTKPSRTSSKDEKRRKLSPISRRSRSPKRRSKSPRRKPSPRKRSRSPRDKSPLRKNVEPKMVNPMPRRSSRSKSPVPKRIRSPVSDSWEAKAAQFLKSIGDDQAAFKLIQATRAKSPPLNERKTKTAKPLSTTPPPMEPQPTLEERLQKMKQHGLPQETSDAFAAFFAESQKRDSTSTPPKAAKKPHIQRSEDEKNKAELRKMLGVILSMQQLQREGLASMPMFFKVCDEMGINKEEVEKNHMLQQLLTLIAHNTPESQKASSLESMVSSLSAGSRNQAPISSVGNYSNVMSSSSLPTRSGPYGTNISSSMSSGSSFTSAPPEEPFSFVYPGLEDEESDKHKHRPEEVDSVIGRLTYAFGQSNSGASTATNKNLSTYDRFSYGHSEASRPVNSSWQPNYPTIGQSSLNLEAERSSKIPRESIQSKKNDEISVMYESRRAANVNKPTSSSTVGIPQGSLSVTANIPPQSSFDAGYGGSTLRSTTLGNRYSGDQQNTTTGLPTYNAFGSYTPRPGGTTQSSAYGMSGMSTNSTEQMNRQLWNVLNQNPRSNN